MAARSSTPFSPKKPEAVLRSISIVLLASLLPLAGFSPELHLVNPRGGQRGSEMEIHFHGERLDGLTEALFYQPGLSLTDIGFKDSKHATAKLTIAADAPLGEHSLRLRSPGGLTELRSFWVGQFPNISEIEPNATFDQAQRVELNQTIEGISTSEDEDYFICTLKKGQRLSVEVEAMRLGRVMFDAYVAILDPKKFELAACDDTPLLRNDAFVSILAPEDGDYRIVVREAAYEGNESCQYRLHIGTFPRPAAVFPTGGKPGETIEFTFIGDPSGPIQQSMTLPSEAKVSFPVFPMTDGLSAPSPHWITVSPLESVGEFAGMQQGPLAAPATPCAIHGVLDRTQPIDWFKFTAKKDQNLVIRVLARSHRSPLDSILSVHQPDRKQLAVNDDQGSPDSLINWTCPADGEYLLKIRDQLNRSGDDFTYRIEITEKSPGITASLPTIERVKTQMWKTFPVPRGNRYAAVINLTRENTNCDASFQATALPTGITLHAPPIPRSVTSFPVVFEATADAPVAGSLSSFSLSSTGDGPKLTAPLTDTIHHVDINNEGPYHSASFDRIATAVTTEAPFRIDIVPPAVPIVKNGTANLKVRATRSAGFAEKITVRFLWNPPGISGPVTLDIPGDQSEILYELNASADAAPADWQVCILAEANTPQGPVLVSSSLTPLKVAEPYISITLDLAATEQGKATFMLGKIETSHPFEGPAQVELLGLPFGTTCPPLTFTKDQKELTFPIAVAADAKVGKHNGVFCRVLIPENNHTILHQTAIGSTLRIDAPSSPPPAAPATQAEAKPAATQPADPTAKPLSRLEQLRQNAVSKK